MRDQNGRSLGRIYEARGRWQAGAIVVDELLIGRRALLRCLRGPGEDTRGVPWANVVEVTSEAVVVR